MWSWANGNWGGPFVGGEPAQKANVWHSFQLTVNKAHIIFKGKERDDQSKFDGLKPVLEMNGEDNVFTKGKFGIADGPISYIDNVVIYVGSKTPTLSVARIGTNLVLTWAGGTLQEAADITGAWLNVAGATSPLTVTPSGARKFYRVKQ
jgi:hypothetical protein